MKKAYQLNLDGFIQDIYFYKETVNEDFILVMTSVDIWEEQSKSNYVLDAPNESFYKARYVEGVWTEGATQDEIDAITNLPVSPSAIDELKKQQADLVFELMMKGVL